jgi:hypothetical protein
MSTLTKLSVNSTNTNKGNIGKETLYICQTCQLQEKELALPSRNYKYCSDCGNVSVKSHLVETYNWVTSKVTPNFDGIEG